jgi:hypothetical protein
MAPTVLQMSQATNQYQTKSFVAYVYEYDSKHQRKKDGETAQRQRH